MLRHDLLPSAPVDDDRRTATTDRERLPRHRETPYADALERFAARGPIQLMVPGHGGDGAGMSARLADFDRALEEAAMDLGATPWMTFLTITLPLIAPALVSGWLLAFTLSLDDLILTQFVAGAQSQTLPMRVYSSVRLGVDPQINVLATIVVCVAASALTVSTWLTRKNR